MTALVWVFTCQGGMGTVYATCWVQLSHVPFFNDALPRVPCAAMCPSFPL